MEEEEFRLKFHEWITTLHDIAKQLPMEFGTEVMKVVMEMKEYYEKTEPKPPKTIDDAYSYALRKIGTYVALLNEKDQLIRTVRISEEILKEAPKVTLGQRTISVKMTQYLLTVPELKFQKAIPKKTAKYGVFTSDKKEIRTIS